MSDSRSSRSASTSRMVPRLAHREPVRRGVRAWAGRVWGRMCAMPLVPLAAIGVIALGVGFVQYLRETPYFHLQSVAIRGMDRLPEQQVRAFLETHAGIAEGASLLLVDPEDVAQRLTALPEVRRAHVRHIWPDQMVVDLEERVAVGIYVSESASMVFDKTGLLFAASRASDLLNSMMPIVTGMAADPPLEVGKELPSMAFRRAMEYAGTIRNASPRLAERVAELHWDDVAGLTVLLDDGARFRCGHRPAAETGPVIEALLARAGNRRIAHANLVAREHAAVRWIEPPAPPQAATVARRR